MTTRAVIIIGLTDDLDRAKHEHGNPGNWKSFDFRTREDAHKWQRDVCRQFDRHELSYQGIVDGWRHGFTFTRNVDHAPEPIIAGAAVPRVADADNLLVETLQAAQQLDLYHGGTASVKVQNNPYEGFWIATAYWSSGVHVCRRADHPSAALLGLRDALLKARRKIANSEAAATEASTRSTEGEEA